MEDQYILEKWEWTQDDFDNMGWHDCPIYAIRFDDNIYLDIDYIFKWNDNGHGNSYTFWISPATWIFEIPTYLKIDVELDFINGLEIASVSKTINEKGETLWSINTQQGAIIIGAEKFKQIIRRPPSFQFGLGIRNEERGDISFSEISEIDYQNSNDIINRKKNENQLFELKQEMKVLISENDNLDKNQLGTKEY